MDDLKSIIGKVATGATLSRDEAASAFDSMMSGEAKPSQMGGLLMALRVRGETVDEITGAVAAEGIWDAFFVGIDVGDRLTYQLTGQYNCTYVLRNGRWYIKTQQFRQTSLLIKKVAEDGSEKIITFGKPDDKVFDK